MIINYKLKITLICLCASLIFVLMVIRNKYSEKREYSKTVLYLANNQKILTDKIAILLHVFHTNRENKNAAANSIIQLENTIHKYDTANTVLISNFNAVSNTIYSDGIKGSEYTTVSPELTTCVVIQKLWYALRSDINRVIEGGNGIMLVLEKILNKNDQIGLELSAIVNIFQKKYEHESNVMYSIQLLVIILGIIFIISILFILLTLIHKKYSGKFFIFNNPIHLVGKKHRYNSFQASTDSYASDVIVKNTLQEKNMTNKKRIKMIEQEKPPNTGYQKCCSKAIYSQDKGLIDEMLFAVDKLKKSSNQIDLISAIVDDMVMQINLLSLNTTIELENLGISKTGLNLIANDIRTLSEKSVDDAKTVLHILADNISNAESIYHIAEAIAEENQT